jgi:hypothetical protein
MTDWRPLQLGGLRHRPYRDSLTYYAFIFAVFFSILGLIGLGVGIYSTAAGGSRG